MSYRDLFPQSLNTITYLDSAASSLTFSRVIESMNIYYQEYRANIHRGLYRSSIRATEQYDLARRVVAGFINARTPEEIIFTQGTTDGINYLAEMIITPDMEGKKIILSIAEHHSNMLPWRRVAQKYGLRIIYCPVTQLGELDAEYLHSILDSEVAVIAFNHVSNVLGVINPVKDIVSMIRTTAPKARIVVDGAQAVAHRPVSVRDLDVDAYVFSAHKMYGPTGIGVLYVKYDMLEQLIPSRVGGDMVTIVTCDDLELAPIPTRFEAGTPPIAEAIGLMSAINQLQELGWGSLVRHEQSLVEYTCFEIERRPWIKVIGGLRVPQRIGCFSMLIESTHPHDIAYLLGAQSIAVRAGYHCAQPLAEYLNIVGTTRISFGIYTQKEDIRYFFEILEDVHTKLAV